MATSIPGVASSPWPPRQGPADQAGRRAGFGRDLCFSAQRRICSLPRLYKYVNEKLFSKPTYSSFIKLLDNYQRATGREEEVTAEELREQDNFLKEVMKTELMKKLFTFLHEKSECGAGRGEWGAGHPKGKSQLGGR